MKCEKCGKNEATVLYRESINGNETKMHLCNICAKEREESSPLWHDFFTSSLLGGIFAPAAGAKKEMPAAKKCPLCGSDFSALQRSGKVGCPECYGAFSDYLAPTLKRLHGGATHRGRAPKKYRAKLEAENTIRELEAELKRSIENEEYERAAEIRDKLRSLRGKEAN